MLDGCPRRLSFCPVLALLPLAEIAPHRRLACSCCPVLALLAIAPHNLLGEAKPGGFPKRGGFQNRLESFLWGQRRSPNDFLSVVVVYAFFFSAKWLHRFESFGGFQNGGFPTFSGDVLIVSRPLPGLLVDGAFSKINRPRKRQRTNRENHRTIPGQNREKNPEKNREKSRKGQKTTKKEGKVPIGKNPPRLNPPPV